jgi:long-chain acyl-CoA synthetase
MPHGPIETGSGRIAARLHRQVEKALGEVNLSAPQYRLLANLSEGSSLASELAEQMIVSRPSVTALADGLVERSYVTRSHSTGDRRRVVHVLTDQGRQVLKEADEAIERRLAALADNLPETERQRAYKGLLYWRKALDAVREKVVNTG